MTWQNDLQQIKRTTIAEPNWQDDLSAMKSPAASIEEPMTFKEAPKLPFLERQVEAWKGVLFPSEEGYGEPRWTKPTRVEQFYRGVSFIPSAGLRGIGGAIERVNIALTSLVRPLFRAVGKGKLERVAFEELKDYPEEVGAAFKTAFFRRPGEPRTAPTFGEVMEEEYYKPLVGEDPPAYYKPVMDTAFDIVWMFGPKALKNLQGRKAVKVETVLAKYNKGIRAAQARGDVEAVTSLKAMEQQELGQTLGIQAKATKEVRAAAEAVRAAGQAPKAAREGVKAARQAVAVRQAPEVVAETLSPIQKLTSLVKAAKKVQPQYEKIKHLELQRRAAEVSGALRKYKGEEAWKRAFAATKGRIDAPDFTPPGLSMSAAEKTALAEQLRLSNKFLPFDHLQVKKGLNSLLAGYKPEPGQLQLLEREFGSDIVKALLGLRTLPQKLKVAALDAANLPRTLLTSYDISASLRQGYIAGLRHPVKWSKAFVSQIKAFGSEKSALAIENSIRTSKYWPQMVKYKLYQPSITGLAESLGQRPEEFMSRFAQIFPGVKASERAFITFGNKIRADIFGGIMEMWKGTGKTSKDYKLAAQYVNALTGRGKLPFKFLEQNGAVMNALFFSPRWVSSRIQLVGRAAKAIPWAVTGGVVPAHAVSKMAAADLVTFVGANTAMLAAAKFYWGDEVDIEIDPRSSDFGKIRFGNTRFEAFAGYQPLARYVAQALAGERKQTLTGRMFETTPEEVGKRFLRSKLSPTMSFIWDLKTGTTIVGDEMTLARLGWIPYEEAKLPWQKQAGALAENIIFKRFFPIVGQDILDAAVYQGAGEAAITTPLVILGLGGGTWTPSKGQELALLQDDMARRKYGKSWGDLGPSAQRLIGNVNREWQELKTAIKYERRATVFGKQLEQREVKAGQDVLKKLTPSMRRRMKGYQVPIGRLSRRLGDWRLNEERYERYQSLIAENINNNTPKGKVNRKLLENILRSAKRMARNKITVEANIEDQDGRIRTVR